METTLFEQVGGWPTLQHVHKIFYDKVYAHPWLGQFFAGHEQKAIEERQTSFMGDKMGATESYPGKEIRMVHEAMYITPELFDIRAHLLDEALRDAGVPDELRERWLRIDGAFRNKIVKESEESMYHNDWKYKKPIIIPKP